MDVGSLISEFGFPVVLCVGLGYFIFFIWRFESSFKINCKFNA